MRTTRLLIGGLACAAAVTGLTGCGGDKKEPAAQGSPASTAAAPSSAPSPSVPQTSGIEKLTAQQISDKAKAALQAAPSLTLSLSTTEGSARVKGKVSMDRQGHCSGTMAMGTQGSFAILQAGGKAWIKPDAAFLKQMAGAEAAKLMAGKYIAGGTAKDMSSFCDLNQFMKELDSGPTGKPHKLGVQTVNGIRTVALVETEDGGRTTVYVSLEGTPYPVKMVHSGKDGGTALFSDFGKPVLVTPPPASQVIDPSKM